jgi:hypothetical protein
MQVRIHWAEIEQIEEQIKEAGEYNAIDHFELPPDEYVTRWTVTAQEANTNKIVHPEIGYGTDISYRIAAMSKQEQPVNGTLQATLTRDGKPWLRIFWDNEWHSVEPNWDLAAIRIVLI